MKLFLTFQGLQLKRALHKLPFLLGGILLLSGIVALLSFCGMTIYTHTGHEVLSAPLQIDLVVQDTSHETSLAIQFVQHMESTRETLSFRTTSLEEAYEDLEEHRAVAVMILPEGIMDSILDGTNKSIRVLFPASSHLSTLIVKELTNSGATMLDAAQSGIYALTELYLEKDLSAYLSESYDRLNQINLSYALARDRLFTVRSTSALGSSSVMAYYTSSGIWLILLLLGVPFVSFLSKESLCVREKLHQAGISTPLVILSKWITTFFIYSVILFVCLLLSQLLPAQSLWNGHLTLTSPALLRHCLWSLLFVSSYVVALYQITPNASVGILSLTVCSILLLFLSGAFIPTAFFPDLLKNVSTYLPTTYLLRTTAALLS